MRDVAANRARLTGLAAVLAIALGGCIDGPVGASAPDAIGGDADSSLETVIGASELGARFEVDIGLTTYGCSAKFNCSDSFLFDPVTALRVPTLMTGFSCGFEEEAAPRDALLAFNREIVCYAGGNPTDRSTWLPVDGMAFELDTDEQLFFSSRTGAVGDAYTNWGGLISPLASFGTHCEVSAYGFYSFSDGVEGQRVASVQRRPTIMRWQGVVDFAYGPNAYQCHTEPGGPSLVEPQVFTALVVDRPGPADKGQFPVVFDWVLFDDVSVAPEVGAPYQAIDLVVGLDTAFPVASDANPGGLLTRQLRVDGAEDIRTGDICLNLDGEGAITSIAVRVTTGDHIPLGALLVHADAGVDGPFDCDRGGPEERCTLLTVAQLDAGAAPCLTQPMITSMSGLLGGQLEPEQTRLLSASATGGAGELTYAWSFVGASAGWDLTDETTPTPALHAPDKDAAQTQVTVRLTVTDEQDATNQRDVVFELRGETSCQGYLPAGRNRGTGIYLVTPDGWAVSQSFQVHCDMDLAGGGWTLISNRRAHQDNIEACGNTLGQFFNQEQGCGSADAIDADRSYALSAPQRTALPRDNMMVIQYLDGQPDEDDAYIVTLGSEAAGDLFRNTSGAFTDTRVAGVCRYGTTEGCDTGEVYWRYVADSWYASALCSSAYEDPFIFRGNYGLCHDGVASGADYYSSSFTGDRSGHDETKLWGHGNIAAPYQERIWFR